MRTTVDLDDDILAAVNQMRRDRAIGLSEAVNQLARAGLTVRVEPRRFTQRTASVGLAQDVRNIGDVLDRLDAADAR